MNSKFTSGMKYTSAREQISIVYKSVSALV